LISGWGIARGKGGRGGRARDRGGIEMNRLR
jgi:hypothetical protein